MKTSRPWPSLRKCWMHTLRYPEACIEKKKTKASFLNKSLRQANWDSFWINVECTHWDIHWKRKNKASFLIKPWRQGPPWENVECAHWDILKPTLNIEKKQSKFSNQTVALLVEKQSWVCGKESGGGREKLEEVNQLFHWWNFIWLFLESLMSRNKVLFSRNLLTLWTCPVVFDPLDSFESKSLAPQYHLT